MINDMFSIYSNERKENTLESIEVKECDILSVGLDLPLQIFPEIQISKASVWYKQNKFILKPKKSPLSQQVYSQADSSRQASGKIFSFGEETWSFRVRFATKGDV